MDSIDWENLSLEDAQKIADHLTAAFNVVARCYGVDHDRDVSFLNVMSRYEDEGDDWLTPVSERHIEPYSLEAVFKAFEETSCVPPFVDHVDHSLDAHRYVCAVEGEE
jgi:hypothetical protein